MRKLFDYESGSFLPAFLYIELDQSIDFQDFENNPDELKGTFIHEYCHFVQDVSTTYGYSNFESYMRYFLYKISGDKNFYDKEILNHNTDFNILYKGDTNIREDIFLISELEIVNDEDMEEAYPGSDTKKVVVKYNKRHEEYKEFQFGSCCIAESMAYLVEKRLYNIRERKNEFPYNVCEEICKREYAAFAENDIWVMALCELSLLELNAGPFFINALRLMKEKEFIPTTVIDIELFIDEYFKIGFRGDRNVIASILSEVYPECNIDFSPIRKWILTRYELGCELREISKCFISMSLSSEDIHVRYYLWNIIIKELGCPVLVDSNGNRIEGASLDNKEIDLSYMLAPMAINELLDYKGEFIQRPCPLKSICQSADDPSYSEECLVDPRKNTNINGLCPVKGFWRMYRLK